MLTYFKFNFMSIILLKMTITCLKMSKLRNAQRRERTKSTSFQSVFNLHRSQMLFFAIRFSFIVYVSYRHFFLACFALPDTENQKSDVVGLDHYYRINVTFSTAITIVQCWLRWWIFQIRSFYIFKIVWVTSLMLLEPPWLLSVQCWPWCQVMCNQEWEKGS